MNSLTVLESTLGTIDSILSDIESDTASAMLVDTIYADLCVLYRRLYMQIEQIKEDKVIAGETNDGNPKNQAEFIRAC